MLQMTDISKVGLFTLVLLLLVFGKSGTEVLMFSRGRLKLNQTLRSMIAENIHTVCLQKEDLKCPKMTQSALNYSEIVRIKCTAG